MMHFLLILFGFLGGIFGGMGMGSGTLLIPLLAIFLGLNQQMCQGVNLVSFLIMAIFSLIIHYKNNLIEFSVILPVAFNGVLFSILGSFLAGVVPAEILRKLFGIFLCVLGIIQMIKLLKNKQKSAQIGKKNSVINKY